MLAMSFRNILMNWIPIVMWDIRFIEMIKFLIFFKILKFSNIFLFLFLFLIKKFQKFHNFLE
jgi:hypothetical protein